MPELTDEYIRSHVASALAEDIGLGDATTNAIVNANHRSTAFITAREEVVLCGLSLAKEVFNQLDPESEIQNLHETNFSPLFCQYTRLFVTAEMLDAHNHNYGSLPPPLPRETKN